MQQNNMATHDAEVARKAKVEELERIEVVMTEDCRKWGRTYFWMKLSDLRDRIAALKAEGDKG